MVQSRRFAVTTSRLSIVWPRRKQKQSWGRRATSRCCAVLPRVCTEKGKASVQASCESHAEGNAPRASDEIRTVKARETSHSCDLFCSRSFGNSWCGRAVADVEDGGIPEDELLQVGG